MLTICIISGETGFVKRFFPVVRKKVSDNIRKTLDKVYRVRYDSYVISSG